MSSTRIPYNLSKSCTDNLCSKGLWKLPIYRPPTVLDMDLKDVSKLNPMLRIVMCIRLAMPNDEVHMRKPLPTTGP